MNEFLNKRGFDSQKEIEICEGSNPSLIKVCLDYLAGIHMAAL